MAYERSFPGYMLIDWLLQNGEIESRRQGLDLCKALLEHDIIQHGKKNNYHLMIVSITFPLCQNAQPVKLI